jgi:hypothetical protein
MELGDGALNREMVDALREAFGRASLAETQAAAAATALGEAFGRTSLAGPSAAVHAREAEVSEVKRYVTSEYMGLAPDCEATNPDVSGCEFVLASDYAALAAAAREVLLYEPEHCCCGTPGCSETRDAWARLRAALGATAAPEEGR